MGKLRPSQEPEISNIVYCQICRRNKVNTDQVGDEVQGPSSPGARVSCNEVFLAPISMRFIKLITTS